MPVSVYLHRWLQSLGAILQTLMLYLGVAAFTAICLTLVVPGLREQSRQFHTALLDSLHPGLPEQQRYVLQPSTSHQLDTSQRFIETLAGSVDTTVPGVSATQFQALRAYIARKYKIAENVAGSLIQMVFDVGREKNIDPQLLLAVIAIESRYNPFAESHVGAQGLMQVMTRVHKDKFDDFEGGEYAAINPIANIQVGARILQDCIARRGSVAGGLACYVGATGPSDGGYGARVLAERRRLALASGIPVAD